MHFISPTITAPRPGISNDVAAAMTPASTRPARYPIPTRGTTLGRACTTCGFAPPRPIIPAGIPAPAPPIPIGIGIIPMGPPAAGTSAGIAPKPAIAELAIRAGTDPPKSSQPQTSQPPQRLRHKPITDAKATHTKNPGFEESADSARNDRGVDMPKGAGNTTPRVTRARYGWSTQLAKPSWNPLRSRFGPCCYQRPGSFARGRSPAGISPRNCGPTQ
ncbi:hypothetical protein W079_01125 [Mycobacterium tuberculosis TB_RSA169]|nr:hypothetical protein W079_01125 [Mycobacterium tuberculosis TB_RSA169]